MKIIKKNKEAYFNYEVIEKYECGIVLKGSEVKPLRDLLINFSNSYIIISDNNEIIWKGAHIAPYKNAPINNYYNHLECRDRNLLLHKHEILKLREKVYEKQMTLIPLCIYFKGSLIKLEIGLCKGRKNYDKKTLLKERDIKREMDREIKTYK